uniref:Uncharacterized protein n=1 Tax=Pyrodinium bahamense TaxID=73915 RepID=A0A7S0FMV5_9DINO
MVASEGALDAEAEARRREREAEREEAHREFFTQLPMDELTPEEVNLRQALLDALAESSSPGGVRLSLVAQREPVRQAKAALAMPKGVGLGHWIQTRLPGDVILATDPSTGELALRPIGAELIPEHQQPLFEEFFAQLPEGKRTVPEVALRDQLVTALQRLGGQARLSAVTKEREIQQARTAFLPKGAPLLTWIERRLSNEVRVSVDAAGAQTVELVEQHVQAPAVRKVPTPPGLPPPQNVLRTHRQQPQQALPIGSRQASGAPAVRPQLTEEERALRAEESRLAKELANQQFFSSLPLGSFTQQEEELRCAILEAWSSLTQAGTGPVIRLSVICQQDTVRAAKAQLLPEGVSVASWVETRLSTEVELSKDAQGQHMLEVIQEAPTEADLQLDFAPAVQGLEPTATEGDRPRRPTEERDARMAEFFKGPLSPEEHGLRVTLIAAIKNRVAAVDNSTTAMRLSDLLNADPALGAAWQRAKTAWRAVEPPLEASLARWVELRLSEEVRLTREPYVQLARHKQERRSTATRKRAVGEAPAPMPPLKAPRSKALALQAPVVGAAVRRPSSIRPPVLGARP